MTQSDTCPNDSSPAISNWFVWALPPTPQPNNSITRVVFPRGGTISIPGGSGMRLHYASRRGWTVSSERLAGTFKLTSMPVTLQVLRQLVCQWLSDERLLES